jgi:hypothetical protein
MNFRHPICSAIALLICLLLAIPADVGAQGSQSAGKITTVLPIVNVIHGPQQIAASTSQEVFWGDIINTGHLARARVALNDGSILSVGSDSNLTIAKHDAAEQQTNLELNYGRVRASAVKLVKPKANFQIRTPTGVAGVVGTDFAVESDNDTTRVVVYEGKVRFCALVSEEKKKEGEEAGPEVQAPPEGMEQVPSDQDQQNKKKRRVFLGPCVVVAAGAVSSVRFNQAPTQPVPATSLTVTTMANATSTTGAGAAGAGGAAGGGIGAAGGAIVGVSAGVAATVATVVVRSVATTKTCSAPPPTTGGAVPRAECVNKAGNKLPGQRP